MNKAVTAAALERDWDFIVVGTGMGGATLGYALARKGHSVLFLERGRSHLAGNGALTGDFAETFLARTGAPQASHKDTLMAAGRYAGEIEDISGGRPRSFIPFIGSGTGGSSALYGMALERFFATDFTPGQYHRQNTLSSLPDAWPLDYGELAPYYACAESLYRTRGEPDPLREGEANSYLPPQPLHPANRNLHDFLQDKGLHPYRLPMACEQVEDCRSCQSYLCSRGCKNDSSKICLAPALSEHDTNLLDECEVLRLHASRSEVSTLECSYRGASVKLRARNYVLAAGALETPRLLLNSTSELWPAGLGNSHDQVGRNLMRHYIDLYALFCGHKVERNSHVKELAFNDFYMADGSKLGSVQSFGFLPPASILVQEMQQDMRLDLGRLAAAAFGLVKPLVRLALDQIFSRALILASTMEDLPYRDNRVQLSGEAGADGRRRLQIHYTVREEEQARIDQMRSKMKQALRPRRYMQLQQADNNHRIAHACGTCRFGDTPRDSVVDADHRVHGVRNLYIADSSVFPSSGGINPSLTIAALSLRLADHLGK